MKRDELLEKGIALRKQGYSLREISEKLSIAKSTASLWFGKVKLNKEAKKRIKNLGITGRLKSHITNSTKRQTVWDKIASDTLTFKDGLIDYNKDQYKLLIALLYWGEGGKINRRLDFINSDPAMIKAYLFLLRKAFVINNDKLSATLHFHEYHDRDQLTSYWSKITNINKNNFHFYRKPNTGKRKRAGYQGCLSVRYGDITIFHEIMLIIDRFKKSII